MPLEKYAGYVKPSEKMTRDTLLGMVLTMSSALVEAHPGIQQVEIPAEANWREGIGLLWEQTQRSGIEQATNFFVSSGGNTRWETPYIESAGPRRVSTPSMGVDLKRHLQEEAHNDFVEKVCIVHTHPTDSLPLQPPSAGDLRMMRSFEDNIPTQTEIVHVALAKEGIWYYGGLNNAERLRLADERRMEWVTEVEKEHPEIREEIKEIVNNALSSVSPADIDRIFSVAQQVGLEHISEGGDNISVEIKKQKLYDFFVFKRQYSSRILFGEDGNTHKRYLELFREFDSYVFGKQMFKDTRSLQERTDLLDTTVYRWIENHGEFLIQGSLSDWETLRNFYRQESFDVRFVSWDEMEDEPVCAGLEYTAKKYFE